MLTEYSAKLTEIMSLKYKEGNIEIQEWVMPSIILMFLENTIKQLNPKPKLVGWTKFKLLINKVIDHRILHAQEINGMVNTSYTMPAEHLILYMIEIYPKRDKAEY